MKVLMRVVMTFMVFLLLPLAMVCVAFEIARALVLRAGPDGE